MPDNMEITVIDNSGEIKEIFESAVLRALEQCGLAGEGYAKKLAPVDTGALRNSITHSVDDGEKTAYIATNSEYAVYQELGTGKYAEGGGGRPTPWVYQDAKGNWHRTSGNKPHPFIKPAVADHASDYRAIIERELKNAPGG